jgi:hypothetical protein
MWLPDSAIGSELGVQAPIGFWDPLGLCKDGDVDNFKNRRVTKLKRGRVAVRAAMGFIAPDCFEFPGCLSLSAYVPNGLAAFSRVPGRGLKSSLCLHGLPRDPAEPVVQRAPSAKSYSRVTLQGVRVRTSA